MIDSFFPSDFRPARGLPVSRPRPPRHEQRVPDEDGLPPGHPVLHVHDGAPPLRPVRHDPQLRGQQHLPGKDRLKINVNTFSCRFRP